MKLRQGILFLSVGVYGLISSFTVKAEEILFTPDSVWLGNWMEASSQEWKVGFYERFAVYDTDFWEYQSVKPGKRQMTLTLAKGEQQLTLHLRKRRDGKVAISEGKGKSRLCESVRPGFRPYPAQDTSFFPPPYVKADTVTLLGYYRHLEQLPAAARKKTVEVFRNDFMADKQFSHTVRLDSLGRFRLRIPVMALEELTVDWGFLNKKLYVEPGERILLYADAAELYSKKGGSSEEYWTTERNVLFMGRNARRHTEYAYCPSPFQIRGFSDLEGLSDLQVLDSLMQDLSDFRQQFCKYREKYPTLSQKCVSLVEMNALFNVGSRLMQYRYFKMLKQRRSAFDPGYMETVQRTFPLDSEWYYQASSYFRTFAHDYVRYWEEQGVRILDHSGTITSSPVTPTPYLRELLIASEFVKGMEKERQPLSGRKLTLLKEEVLTPAIRERVLADHEKYRKLAAKEMTWLESLKENTSLAIYTDAKKLFEQLIAPYRGNVIYLDIWGTWCSPCREQMKYVGAVKEALKGEKVIFIYLADRSDEKSWKNIIRQYNLTGKNVVHYRLPEEQQALLEQLLNIHNFPTFMLLDKEGNIVNPEAERPERKAELVKQIRKLLKN